MCVLDSCAQRQWEESREMGRKGGSENQRVQEGSFLLDRRPPKVLEHGLPLALDFMLSEHRDEAAALRFMAKATTSNGRPRSCAINTSRENTAGSAGMNAALRRVGSDRRISVYRSRYGSSLGQITSVSAAWMTGRLRRRYFLTASPEFPAIRRATD